MIFEHYLISIDHGIDKGINYFCLSIESYLLEDLLDKGRVICHLCLCLQFQLKCNFKQLIVERPETSIRTFKMFDDPVFLYEIGCKKIGVGESTGK